MQVTMNLIQEFKVINLQNAKNEISRSKGIYIWLNKKDEIVYVGIACGKNGLFHRIKCKLLRISRFKT